MHLRAILLTLALVSPAFAITPAGPATAQAVQPELSPAVAAFSRSLRIAEMLDVMRAEGIAASTDLSDSLFPGENAAAWATLVDNIYDLSKMQARFDAALAQAVGDDPGTLAAATAFFDSNLGQRIMVQEIEARRTLLDKAAEAAAAVDWADTAADQSARAEQIIRFGAVNDLIESNVMGSLNANLAFYRGLSGTGGFGDPMPEDQMLAEVWGQEAEIRQETSDWLYPFLALAYQPLSDAELESYIAFSQTPAGIKINGAIFVAFDAVMVKLSSDLGQAAGRLMQGQDI